MSKLDQLVYELPIPIDICNIILSYKTQSRQKSDHRHGRSLYYECENVIVNCDSRNIVICVIDNIIYNFRVYQYGSQIHVYRDNLCIKILDMYLGIFTIKYSTGLICEYEGLVVLYDVTITANDIILTERHRITNNSEFVTLLYADTNYIIINNDEVEVNYRPGMTIYNNNFELIKYIPTDNMVKCVAYYKNILSYCMIGNGNEAWRTGTWHRIFD